MLNLFKQALLPDPIAYNRFVLFFGRPSRTNHNLTLPISNMNLLRIHLDKESSSRKGAWLPAPRLDNAQRGLNIVVRPYFGSEENGSETLNRMGTFSV